MKHILGAHLSTSKGLHNAIYEAEMLCCDTLQIFTKNSQTWRERSVSNDEINLFDKAKKEANIKLIASHTSYLINLATSDKKKRHISVNALRQELLRSSDLKIDYAVLHPGSHMGEGEEKGIALIIENIEAIFESAPEITTRLLLETTAGQGTGLGHTFEQIRAIMDGVGDNDKIGVCLDTCHIFAAGYDMRDEKTYSETFDKFDKIIGIENLYVIHVNDSKKKLGSRVDRHEHIGEGFIGINGFKYLMNDGRFVHIPKILETPKMKDGIDMDPVNLEKLRHLIV